MKKITVGNKKPLVENLLLVEGITRAGKFLLANILAGFKGIEPVQNFDSLEKIPVLARFNLVDKKVAEELLRCEVDMHCYEMLIGRNFNHRLSDKSSIFNHPRNKEYLKRCILPDGVRALARFYKENPYSFFIVHEMIPNIDIYFNLFPKIKIISIQRSPVDLVFSWYKRGYGWRIQNDPRVWVMSFKKGKIFFPWYIFPHQKKYTSLSEMDRLIFSIQILFNAYKKKYKSFSNLEKKKILIVNYEDIMLQPVKLLGKISSFLDKKPTSDMANILKREHLPKPSYFDAEKDKILEIKKHASSECFGALMRLQKEYLLKRNKK